jgi:acetyl-CoA carboxylase carboxyl transferase subunit alpha
MEEITRYLDDIKALAKKNGVDVAPELFEIAEKFRSVSNVEAVWREVELARNSERPSALDYIENIFTDWTELHGDRYFADDHAVVGGLAFLDGRPVTVLGTQKGRNLKDNMYRNHGMGNPEGYRKALRLARQAEKFHRPIVAFVDTAGAYPGVGAEERGVGQAIAMNLREFSQLKTPIISVIIGEGGSGGALALCVGDKIYMLEHTIYSVISPEGGASIMLHDAGRAKDAAALLRITSNDIWGFKLLSGVIPEPEGGAQTDPEAAASAIKKILIRDLDDLCRRNPAVIVRYRNRKIQKIGHWNE